ncbi:MAG: hypothetical protein PHC68_03485 [Syntrophorhabdaceae bacterium]|nr:hypothetical protein [Syntrophorhabdaceae bacterium]
MKLMGFIGLTPTESIRNYFFYPLWKSLLFLTNHKIELLIVFLCVVHILLYVYWRINKYPSFKVVAVWVLVFIALIVRIYFFNPLTHFNLKKDEINVVIFPLFNVDAETFLVSDEYSAYFQETMHRLLIENGPSMPYPVKVNFVNFPQESIPLFLYKPNTLHWFFDRVDNSTFIVWGYRLKDNFEKIELFIQPLFTAYFGYEQEKEEDKFRRDFSSNVSLLFNELKSIPFEDRMNFFSLLISSVLDQSLNTILVENGEYETAQKQINSSLSKIDNAFNRIIELLPTSRYESVNAYYARFRGIFLDFKTRIKEIGSNVNYLKEFDLLMKNLYAPFKSEQQYFTWLSKQEGVYSFSRVTFLVNKIVFDSSFERFICYLNLIKIDHANMRASEVKKMFNKLRAKHGNQVIIDFYEAFYFLCRYEQKNYIKSLLSRQKAKINRYNKDLVLRHEEFFELLKDAEGIWRDGRDN